MEKAVADKNEHRKFRILALDEETMKMLKEYLGRGGANSKKHVDI
jgi:integrase/recombinase XerD